MRPDLRAFPSESDGGTALGMAPLCFAQAWLAGELLTAIPELTYPLVAACVLYLVFVVVVLKKMLAATV